ncbi:hypothetical protein ON010_g13937 [Phytophthora cinnamomi]|nr:hypothetical protein ON010_g13937 [Phytophthora cinnamomi]
MLSPVLHNSLRDTIGSAFDEIRWHQPAVPDQAFQLHAQGAPRKGMAGSSRQVERGSIERWVNVCMQRGDMDESQGGIPAVTDREFVAVPPAKVGRAHFQQMLSNLDALDTEQRAILPWDLTEAHVSKFVKEILHCTLLSGKEPDLSLKAETRLESTKVLVRGRADYAITQGNTTLLAAEVKKYNLPQGVAQALLMLDIAFNPASLSNVVGVVTHLSTWYFFKRTVDRIYWSSDTIAKATRDRDAVRVVSVT